MWKLRPEALDEVPPIDPEIVRAEDEDFQRELGFWREHFEEFLQKYPKLWVVVRDGEVITTDPDLYALWAKLDQLGIDATAVWIRHFDPSPPAFRL